MVRKGNMKCTNCRKEGAKREPEGILCYSCHFKKWRESEIREADIDFDNFTEIEIKLPLNFFV